MILPNAIIECNECQMCDTSPTANANPSHKAAQKNTSKAEPAAHLVYVKNKSKNLANDKRLSQPIQARGACKAAWDKAMRADCAVCALCRWLCHAPALLHRILSDLKPICANHLAKTHTSTRVRPSVQLVCEQHVHMCVIACMVMMQKQVGTARKHVRNSVLQAKGNVPGHIPRTDLLPHPMAD